MPEREHEVLYRKLKNMYYHLLQIFFFLQYLLAGVLGIFLKHREKYRHLWIIAERGVDAGDNAYHLFCYIREHFPEINIRFVISKTSSDRKKVEEAGEVVNYRSFSHMLAFVLSEVKISTHIMGFSPDMVFFRELDRKNRIKGKKIFLQHGVIKDQLPYLYADANHLDLFVCGAEKEWEFVHGTFGYREGVVRFLGLCRYDQLPLKRERSEKVLLLMPTWRIYLSDLSKADFKRCEFYQKYQSLLNSQRLEELLEQYGYRLKFCPHFNLLPYIDCFESKNDRIEIVLQEEREIQKLLIQADVLLTDFSSVFFDFAFMQKPVLYYQFDQKEFFNRHYQKGYFSYADHGFGAVAEEEETLLDELAYLLKRDCQMAEPYRSRAEAFFGVRDHNNCRRNFEAILSLTGAGEKDWRE